MPQLYGLYSAGIVIACLVGLGLVVLNNPFVSVLSYGATFAIGGLFMKVWTNAGY